MHAEPRRAFWYSIIVCASLITSWYHRWTRGADFAYVNCDTKASYQKLHVECHKVSWRTDSTRKFWEIIVAKISFRILKHLCQAWNQVDFCNKGCFRCAPNCLVKFLLRVSKIIAKQSLTQLRCLKCTELFNLFYTYFLTLFRFLCSSAQLLWIQ